MVLLIDLWLGEPNVIVEKLLHSEEVSVRFDAVRKYFKINIYWG